MSLRLNNVASPITIVSLYRMKDMLYKNNRNTQKRKVKRRRRNSLRKKLGGSSQPPYLVVDLNPEPGFGSQFGFMLEHYIFAKKNNIEFRVKNNNWQYSPEKGWHDFFVSLKEYDPSKNTGERRPISNNDPPFAGNYTAREYTKAIEEIYKPNDEILHAAAEFIKGIGGPFVSFYIRKGDKVKGASKETDEIDVSSIVEKSGVKDGSLYVMTDDYSVVDEVQKLLPQCKVITNTEKEKKGYFLSNTKGYNVKEKRRQAQILFTSIEIFHNGEKGWVDGRSNMGRLLKLRDWDKVVVYPEYKNISPNIIVHPPTRHLGH